MQRYRFLTLCVLTARLSAEVLFNGISMPAAWPPQQLPTQAFRQPSYLTTPPAVIPVNVGRQLFVDDFLIESTTLTRTQHRPTMFSGNPIMRTSLNGERAMPFSDGVWYDPADRIFKMWYWGPSVAPYLCYAYSYDGKTWVKPSLPNGAIKNTNVVINFGGGRDSGTVWMDLEDPNPAKKFKGFFYGGGGQLRVFYSPDGIVWTEQPFKINSLSDRTTLFWNPFRKLWVNSARSSAVLPATPTRAGTSARSRYYFESTDLQNWLSTNATYSFWTSIDDRDPAYPGTSTFPHLYNLDAVAYESVFVGLFNLYYPEPAPLLVELNAGFSRDGYQWVRPTRGAADKAFIPSTNRDGDWNAFNTQSVGGGFLVVGDELWFYFSGRSGRHGTAFTTHQMQTGMAMLRRDGFYSMDAPAGEGVLTTRKLSFTGSNLFVNVNAPAGTLQAEVLDENSAPIPGFTRAESIPFTGNSTKQALTWSSRPDMSSLIGRTVRVRFYLTKGELYAFWITPDANGASFGYVAAGGPGFVSNRDTGEAVPPSPDTTAPSVPSGLSAVVSTAPSVQLTWSASTDNEAVTGYRVHRNGSVVGTSSGTGWVDTGVSAGQSYSYAISALDAAGNASAISTAVAATVPKAADTTAPTVPASLSAAVTTAPSVRLTWSPCTDNVGVTAYRVYRNGSVAATAGSTTWTDTAVAGGQSYSYAISAVDAAGNASAISTAVAATVPKTGDTTAPTTPTSLNASITTLPSVQLTWSPSTDNVGVTGYRVYRNGSVAATAGSTTWTDTAVAAGQSYSYSVSAVDASGNASPISAAVPAAIPGVVVPPPPTGNGQYIRIEAETGSVLAPWQSLYLGPVYLSNGFFIRSRTANTGTRTYTVNAPVAGTYTLWGRGSSSSSGGSFYVKMDAGAETFWPTPTWSYGTWTWLKAGTFNLTAGTHTLTLRAGISYTYLDVMMLTNDAGFVPSGIAGK